MERGGIALFILDGSEWSASRFGRVKPGKEALYPLNRGMGGPHSRTVQTGGEKKHFAHAATRTLVRPARRLVSIPATQSQKLCVHLSVDKHIA